jgi:hypothetical protein
MMEGKWGMVGWEGELRVVGVMGWWMGLGRVSWEEEGEIVVSVSVLVEVGFEVSMLLVWIGFC